jgi:hypothetical protein
MTCSVQFTIDVLTVTKVHTTGNGELRATTSADMTASATLISWAATGEPGHACRSAQQLLCLRRRLRVC